MSDCKPCMGFGVMYFPEMVWETTKDGAKQARWVYRSVKCAACFVQLRLFVSDKQTSVPEDKHDHQDATE